MIGRLHGHLALKKPPALLIDVNGVGYELLAPMSTFYRLPECGEKVTLHTHLVVREDVQQLFGFFTEEERMLFRHLIKTSGVGPKSALAILSNMETSVFVAAIMQNDTYSLVKLPGIGKKTAERLIIEMRDRLKDWVTSENGLEHSTQVVTDFIAEATSALVALGYKLQEATRMIKNVSESATSSEELIRLALRGQA